MAAASAVWDFFTVSVKDLRSAICKTCSSDISRGGNTNKDFNTTNLKAHLKSRHIDQYNDFLKADKKRQDALAVKKMQSTSKAKTLSIATAFEKRNKFPMDSAKAKNLNKKVMEFIALDDQPFSVVGDVGFRGLVEYMEPRYTLPSRRHLAEEFTGSHAANFISETFEKMFETWKIPKSKVHVVVRDNARNMAKAMKDSKLNSFGCTAHSLQLVIHDGVLTQPSVEKALAICRKIVGHSKHSPLAYSRLQAVQTKVKRLQQDVPTRWNSTFLMMESLLEQKHALATYAADHDLPANLTAQHWGIIENLINLLSPFEQLTRDISSSEASVADVIPSVRALRRLLSKTADTDHAVKTTKTALLESVNKRFSEYESNPTFLIATLLDPRYKDRYFNDDVKLRARAALDALVDTSAGDETHRETADEDDHPTSVEPLQKRARIDEEERERPSLYDMFEEILQEKGPQRPRTRVSEQLESFFAEATIPRNAAAVRYWQDHHQRFPALARIARKYLCAPCTSVDSERLFSSVAHVLDEKRNRLAPDKAEMLIFVKKNMHLTRK
ncbi:zinc finger BED domain-containing protein 4-like [Pleuronectes platessa]|uniref:zinc finger BED domain-containing protein 4-like n=1 Tax=Pleuronectes platessa TaxID=8262 RepID=UPI00232A30FE|nr:zinc finger BED domain-containing protein 4-like [Pleuronectes platessa]